MQRPWIPAAAIASLAALLPAAPAAAAPRTYTVVMDKMKFGPVQQVKVGDSIIWVNGDILKHSATAKDGSFNVDLPPGAKARMVVRKAGAIPFYCRYHPGMRGTLSVAR
jgi:plastocyanin